MFTQALYERAKRDIRHFHSNEVALDDYVLGTALGAGGQQLMNAATDGVDPNPFISGLMTAPIYRLGRQIARATLPANMYEVGKAYSEGRLDPENVNPSISGKTVADFMLKNRKIETALGTAALVGGVPAGAVTSLYNTVTGGNNYDNNLISAIGILAALAPISHQIIKRNAKPSSTPTPF